MPKKRNQSNESEAPVTSAQALIHECISPAQWRELIGKQFALAQEGNKGALELLLEYGFGRPTTVPTRDENEPRRIRLIVYHAPKPEGGHWTQEDGEATELTAGEPAETNP